MQQLETPMATLTIRNVDAAVKERLRVRAARHGRSMEAEARTILSDAVAAEPDERDRTWPRPSAGALRRSAASISSCRRARRSASRRRSIRDRRRHQRDLGADARRARSRGAGLGRRAAPRAALHDLCQSGGNSVWHWRAARGPAAHGLGRGGDRHVRRGFRWPDSCRSRRARRHAIPRSCWRGAMPVTRSRNLTR